MKYQSVSILIAVVKNTRAKAIARKEVDIHHGWENIALRLAMYVLKRKQQLLKLLLLQLQMVSELLNKEVENSFKNCMIPNGFLCLRNLQRPCSNMHKVCQNGILHKVCKLDD